MAGCRELVVVLSGAYLPQVFFWELIAISRRTLLVAVWVTLRTSNLA